MKRLAILCIALLALYPHGAGAQSTHLGHAIAGTVVNEWGRPIAFAEVVLSGQQRATMADDRGAFRLSATRGRHDLMVSAIGHAVTELTIDVPLTSPLRVVLRADPVALETLTVTGTMQRTSVAESPVKVEVVPARVLQRNATNNLTEAIQYVNGLYTQIDCGVCYTNNIRINGMEGPYTAVLIDGMPLMSALASVYGLNGLNPALIEQIEIVKGPASTLYGSEAMAGVINVITKDPRFVPRLAVDVRGTSDAEGNVDLAAASEPADVSVFVSGNLAYNQRFVDENGDGFSDFPLTRRGVVFAKIDAAPGGVRRGGLSARYLYEDRFGGVEAWTSADRGSDRVYGESIVTRAPSSSAPGCRRGATPSEPRARTRGMSSGVTTGSPNITPPSTWASPTHWSPIGPARMTFSSAPRRASSPTTTTPRRRRDRTSGGSQACSFRTSCALPAALRSSEGFGWTTTGRMAWSSRRGWR